MRIKALLGVAAISAIALSAVAQSNVYSLNVVGYVNIPLVANARSMIANQLNTTNNTVANVLANVAPGTQLFKYNSGFSSYVFDYDENNNVVWSDPAVTLNPGEGAFIQSPVATTITLVGEVMQGSLANTLPTGTRVIRSSMVPQAGGVTSVLGVPSEAGDQLFTYANGYTSYVYDYDENNNVTWGTEPVINVGQSFFYQKSSAGTATSWVRNFTVQ